MSLTILGRDSTTHAVAFRTDQGERDATPNEIADLRAEVIRNRTGIVRHEGVPLDESDVDELIRAMANESLPLWPEQTCTYGDAAATEVIEGRPHCPGHAAGYALAETESERAS